MLYKTSHHTGPEGHGDYLMVIQTSNNSREAAVCSQHGSEMCIVIFTSIYQHLKHKGCFTTCFTT